MRFVTPLIQKLINNQFVKYAIILSGLFFIAHLLGFREYTNILSGTGAIHVGRVWGGLLYLLLYVSVAGIVPVLLLAAVLRYGARRILSVFIGKDTMPVKGDVS